MELGKFGFKENDVNKMLGVKKGETNEVGTPRDVMATLDPKIAVGLENSVCLILARATGNLIDEMNEEHLKFGTEYFGESSSSKSSLVANGTSRDMLYLISSIFTHAAAVAQKGGMSETNNPANG